MGSRNVLRWMAVALIGLALVGAACSADDEMATTGDSAGAIDIGRPMEEPVADDGSRGVGYNYDNHLGTVSDSTGQTGGGGDNAGRIAQSDTSQPPIGPTVIKTADLRVRLGEDRLGESVRELTTLASKLGGFVLSSSVSDDAEHPSASIVIRVPAERFELALADIDEIGDVFQEAIRGEDVGQEFVDLEARLRNYSAQQAVLLKLMDEAVSVSDTIRVQNELQGVQLEMERIKGRLRYLDDQTSFGTIAVTMKEKDPAAVAPKNAGLFERAWDQAKETTGALVSAIVLGASVVLPVLMIAAPFLLLLWFVVRRFSVKLGSTP